MTMSEKTVLVTLRFPRVSLSRTELETAFGVAVDRFQDGSAINDRHAQINLREDATWDDVIALVGSIGPAVQRAFGAGHISRPEADVGLLLVGSSASASLIIPAAAVSELARWGFDIRVSAYLAQDD